MRTEPYFNRWDICEAYWVYSVVYNAGQGSPEYALNHRITARMGFNPGLNLIHKLERGLTENGAAIFERLVRGESAVRS